MPWVMDVLAMPGECLAHGNGNRMGALHRDLRLHLREVPLLDLLLHFRRTDDGFYETNDSEGRYFKDRYAVDAHFPDDGYVTEYFPCLEKTLDWVSRMCGCAICSEKDLGDLNRQWKSAGTDNYCYLYQYNVV